MNDSSAGTILVVDDEGQIGGLVKLALERHGYRVVQLGSSAEALEATAENREIDLLITDVLLPDMSGRQLADRIRDMLPGVKVLFMSGLTSSGVIRKGVSADEEFLQKPFSIGTLLEKVRDRLAAP